MEKILDARSGRMVLSRPNCREIPERKISPGLAILLDRVGSTPSTAAYYYLVAMRILDDRLDTKGYGLLHFLCTYFGTETTNRACDEVSKNENAATNENNPALGAPTFVRSGAAVYRVGARARA